MAQAIIQPWQVLLAALAGWINRHQQAVIEYLQEENRPTLGQGRSEHPDPESPNDLPRMF